MPKKEPSPEDFIVPLNINGLQGRMIQLPAKKAGQPELLFLYGQHSSLERWWGLALELNKLGRLTMPDLPGLGGMTNFRKIGKKGDIDDMADYLAAFIKLRYKNKKLVVLGMSIGFVIVTRMLQKYPEMSKKVSLLVSVVGFAHGDDFVFTKRRRRIYIVGSKFFSTAIPGWFFQHVLLRPFVLRKAYHKTYNAKEKFENISGDEFQRTMDMEIKLWSINDIRTQMLNSYEMLTLDNCRVRVDLPVHHVAAKKDRYFDNVRVEEHMRKIFNDFHLHYTKAPNHAPTIVATAKEAAPFIPESLRRIVRKLKD